MEYKPRKRNVILNSLSIVVLLFLLNIYSDSIDEIFLFIFIIIIIYMFWFFISERVTSIKINFEKKEITFMSIKYFFKKKQETYSVSQLNFSYQKEITSRGMKINKFRLSLKRTNEVLFFITPNFNGWSEDDLGKVYSHLLNLNDEHN